MKDGKDRKLLEMLHKGIVANANPQKGQEMNQTMDNNRLVFTVLRSSQTRGIARILHWRKAEKLSAESGGDGFPQRGLGRAPATNTFLAYLRLTEH